MLNMMNVYVNGQEATVPDECNIVELLNLRDLDSEKVVVEKNEVVISSKDFADEYLSADDRIEILQFVGGG